MRDRLLREVEPDEALRAELKKVPLDDQIASLAFIAGMRKVRPIRH